MDSKQIRKKFFSFFEKKGHTKVKSSSLIPSDDPTLLFTNAGMNQFKNVFLGKKTRSYSRATSIQKCVRAGGKHNDLDNVGFTKRHLTFFEMMGNFSFGDYFKKDAIEFAWEFLTHEMNLPQEQLYVSVYKTDDESFDIWHKKIGLPQNKIYRLGEEDNFWQMGDTGPCGPCSEIHLDRGPEYGCKNLEDCSPSCDCERFVEIWNLVFMQYDRQVNGEDTPLKRTGVDTGMGFERLCMIMQKKDSVFDIDAFEPIRKEIEKLTNKNYDDQNKEIKNTFHVLEDHIRSSTFLIADGCIPSNEGRGYVLRKIIRRAALFSLNLADNDIFSQLAHVVIEEMSPIYPDLHTQKDKIITTLKSEIEKFAVNLIRGKKLLLDYLDTKPKSISGKQAFKLYDTFGFPLELLEVFAREHSISIDKDEFEKLMCEQQERSGKKMGIDPLEQLATSAELATEFTGYNAYQAESKINALIKDNKSIDGIKKDETCWLIPEKSPFFVLGGGQESDKGSVVINDKTVQVKDVRYAGNAIALAIKAPMAISVGDTIIQIIDEEFRKDVMRNHTATHLLQAALIETLGDSIKQAGSFVGPDYLRFDFTYPRAINKTNLNKVENLTNKKIRENIPVCIKYMPLEKARKKGAIALFGEKYASDNVRVVEVPGFSAELCCGTHVQATGDIGILKITEEKALASGQRRITAVTGRKAVELFQNDFDTIKKLSSTFTVPHEKVTDAALDMKTQLKNAQDTIKKLKKENLKISMPKWISKITDINGVNYLALTLADREHDELKDIAINLQKAKPGLYALTSEVNDKLAFLASLSPQLKDTISLKKLAQNLREKYGLRGGGSPMLIQGSGKKTEINLEEDIQNLLQK